MGGAEVAVDGLGVYRGAAGFSRTIDEQAGQRRRVANGAVRISFADRLYQAGANALVAEWHRVQALHRHRLVHRLARILQRSIRVTTRRGTLNAPAALGLTGDDTADPLPLHDAHRPQARKSTANRNIVSTRLDTG